MTLTNLKRIEAAYGHLRKVFEAIKKEDPSPAVKELAQKATDQWLAAYRDRCAAEVAVAAKRDKGAVLCTLFIPGGYYMKESVQTPNRNIDRIYWQWHSRGAVLERKDDEQQRALDARYEDPWKRVAVVWARANVECDQLRERRQVSALRSLMAA